MPIDVSVAFRPLVPVFDCNASVGRRHDSRVALDTPAALLTEMDRCGVGRALVVHPHAVHYATQAGNAMLLELIAEHPRLVPQFVANPVVDDPEAFGESLREAGVRSVRFCPRTNLYPFVQWVVGHWLEWLAEEGLPLWLPAADVEPRDLFDLLYAYPEIPVVLVAPTYGELSTTLPLLRALPNLYLDLSRWDVYEGPARVRDEVGIERLLYGSNLPEFEPGSYLFYLHRCGFSQRELEAVCAGNLERLLWGRAA